ncbi:hypothetical protein GYH30_009709 [Glycine max]|nr:hypothetical protein GYH30_009709 [Glycine max]
MLLSLRLPHLGFVMPLRPGERELPLHDRRLRGLLPHHLRPAQPRESLLLQR